jgi:hypothetical protein
MIQGQLYKVFEFPDDITIGDITFNKLGEVPAKGTRAVIANDYITFAPDQVLVKHPQYLSRFKPGDFHGLKIAGLYASDPLLKLVCKFPQVDRLQLDECPNITSMAVKYIDAMPALIDFEVGQHTLNAEALSHMTRLKSLKRVGFCYRSDSESFLKLLKGSQTVQMLTLNRSMVTRQGFEYVATLPNLEQLILSSARFTSADLQPLAKLKKLKAICITEHAVDPNLILALRSIRSLKMVEFTEKRASPISDDRVASELPGVRVLWQANMNEALNPKLEFGTP